MSDDIRDLMNPAVPAGAYDDLLAEVLPAARSQRAWQPDDGPLPVLFVSHGAPMTLDDPRWLRELFAWAQSMPKPRAVLVVSAHWESAPLALSASAAGTPLYYDFGGFHRRYYTLPYATPDATDLADIVTRTLSDTTPLHHHPRRGLDHGAFIPLMAMYPAADVPVAQLSMPTLAPDALLALGQRLRPLRDEGILVVGSGQMTHSFAALHNPSYQQPLQAFDTWVAESLSRGDIDAIADYRHRAPGAAIAHPTAEHFSPLLLALGAAKNPSGPATTVINRMWLRNSIRSVELA